MKRLMQRAAAGIAACLSLGACLPACARVVESSFYPSAPDSGVSATDDSSLGGGDTALVFLPPPNNDDASIWIDLSGEGGPTGPGVLVVAKPNALKFVPPSATVTVVDGTLPAVTQNFELQADFGNGFVKVTAQAVEFDRPDLATVTDTEPVVASTPPTATATPYAGTGKLHAVYGGVEAIATLTVQVHLSQYATGLTATSPSVVALGGSGLTADATVKSILYPYDGTVWPLGLQAPLVMWSGAQMTDVYRLHYAETNYTIDSYTTLAAVPAQVALDQALWDRLTNSNEAAHGAMDPVTFSLSRYDMTANKAYAAATETWSVAPESLRGSIYYWTASRGATGGQIVKFNPGPGATPTVLTTTGKCAGCHAVNALGTLLVADSEDQAAAPSLTPFDDPATKSRAWGTYDLTKPTAPLKYLSTKFGADPALTPDGAYLVFGGPRATPGAKYLSLADPLTGTVVTTSGLDQVTLDPGEGSMEMPAFSPDGTKLVVVESTSASTGRGLSDNVLPSVPETLAYLTFDQSKPAFNPTLHKIVDSSSAVFGMTNGLPANAIAYPSFTPDSKAVAFHAGTASTGCNGTGCDDGALDDGNLFLARLAGGAPLRMSKASDSPDPADLNSSVEPTFNPFVRGGYSWVVFTSTRKYGNKPWPTSLGLFPKCAGNALCNGKRRLWLAAVDTTLGTTDPSHPAIYLEGQEPAADALATPNMRGFYTLAKCIPSPGMTAPPGSPPVGTMCTAGFECCSGFCQGGMCVQPNQLACVGLGGACKMTGDCCNSQIVSCINGICAVLQTR